MLSSADLLAFAARQDGVKTLTVYLPIAADAPTPPVAARTLLRQGLAKLRDTLTDATHLERTLFDGCAERLTARAAADIHRQGGGTWVGFASANGVTHDETLPPGLSASFAWDDRVHIVPYLRAASSPPALVVLVDRERARMYRFNAGALTELEQFTTEATIDLGTHMGGPPRQSFHTGTRGSTATDAVQRETENASAHHCARIRDRITALRAADDVLVLGGAGGTVAHVLALLPVELAHQTAQLPPIGYEATIAQLRLATERAVASVRESSQRQCIDSLIARQPSPALTMLGRDGVDLALTHGAVARTVIADRWSDAHEVDAEDLVRRTVAQHGTADIVSGSAARLLDVQGIGVAARLRFPVPAGAHAGLEGVAGSGIEN